METDLNCVEFILCEINYGTHYTGDHFALAQVHFVFVWFTVYITPNIHFVVEIQNSWFWNLKDAMPVSLRSELFTSYIFTIFKQ